VPAVRTLTKASADRSIRALRVGLIGLGAIGCGLADLIAADSSSRLALVGALVRDCAKPRDLNIPVTESFDELLGFQPDVVAEAGGHEALRMWGPACLRASVPLTLLSAGALADVSFELELRAAAEEGATAAVIASGGIGGLDLLASAAEGRLDNVRHTIVKTSTSLGLPMSDMGEVFRGSARQAALRFPQNANVAATVALAGLGLDASEVVIVADPAAARTQHVIEASGAFGDFRLELRSAVSHRNPRTAAVVAMSLKHSLEGRRRVLVVG
jgi:aspartate dehydrogenase